MIRKGNFKDIFPLVDMGPGGCWLNMVTDNENLQLQRYAEMEKTFKSQQQAVELMDYRVKPKESKDLTETQCVENEDALKLMGIICGGYVEDDFGTYLSYNDFQQKKQEFSVLKSVYQSVQKKYHSKKVEQGTLRFRSVLMMVYLEQNIPKLSRARVQQLFNKNRIVW